MMRADNPLAVKEAVQRADFLQGSLIVSEQVMKHHEMDHYFGSAAEKIEVAGTYNLLYNTIFFIEAGMGSALCFKGMADAVGSSRGLVVHPLGPRDLLGELCGLAQRPGLLPRRSSRRGGPGRGVL